MGKRLKSGSIEEISFPLFVFAREDKNWRDGKLICLVEKKNEKLKNKVGINL